MRGAKVVLVVTAAHNLGYGPVSSYEGRSRKIVCQRVQCQYAVERSELTLVVHPILSPFSTGRIDETPSFSCLPGSFHLSEEEATGSGQPDAFINIIKPATDAGVVHVRTISCESPIL